MEASAASESSRTSIRSASTGLLACGCLRAARRCGRQMPPLLTSCAAGGWVYIVMERSPPCLAIHNAEPQVDNASRLLVGRHNHVVEGEPSVGRATITFRTRRMMCHSLCILCVASGFLGSGIWFLTGGLIGLHACYWCRSCGGGNRLDVLRFIGLLDCGVSVVGVCGFLQQVCCPCCCVERVRSCCGSGACPVAL